MKGYYVILSYHLIVIYGIHFNPRFHRNNNNKTISNVLHSGDKLSILIDPREDE